MKVRTFIDHLVEHFSRMAPYLPGDAAATPAAAARVAQAKRAVAERALALPEFDDLDEAALVARGTVTVASAATAATQGARKVSRSARMAEPLSAGLQG
jgi:SpoU rRNA methylase family enzyme